MFSDPYPSNNHNDTDQPEKVETHVADEEARYWAEFYSRTDFNEGSSFFEFVNGLPEFPETIIDIGCGQGRDSFAFAQAGKRVLGVDRSDVGVQHAGAKAASEGLDTLTFATCDVSDEVSLAESLMKAREMAGDGNLCYYMRFFLHSIPEDAQATLMDMIAVHAQPGDVFTAEFRTDKDESANHVFGESHYRRYQNADEFSKKLRDDHGWEIVHEIEDKGLARYRDEDPTVYRVVAVRP